MQVDHRAGSGVRSARAFVQALFVGALAGVCAPAAAQFQFQRAVGIDLEERANGIEQTSDGGYVTVGFRQIAGAQNQDIYVCRYDATGALLWDRYIGGSLNDVGHTIKQTLDGGFIIAAETASMGPAFGIALVRLDGAGNLLWARGYEGTGFVGGRNGVAVEILPDNGFGVVGRIDVAAGGRAGILLRTTAAGLVVFNNAYRDAAFPTSGAVSFADLRVSATGFTVVGSDAAASTAQRDMLLTAIGPAGNVVWAVVHGDPAADEDPDSLEMDSTGEFAFTARDSSIAAPGGSRFVKTTAAGAQIVTWPYRGFLSHHAALREDIHGNHIMGGDAVFATTGLTAACLLLADPVGGPRRAMVYGGFTPNGGDFGRAAIPTRDCGYALAGYTQSFQLGGPDKYFVKTDKCLLSGCNEANFDVPPAPKVIPQRGAQLIVSSRPESVVWQPVVTKNTFDRVLCFDTICLSDFNCDGFSDGIDYDDFINAWLVSSIAADVNCDGFVDAIDYDDFITAWLSGC